MSASAARRGAAPLIWTGIVVAIVSMAAHFRVPLLPDMGAELALTPAVLGLLTSSFGVGRLLTDLPAGAMVDRFGASTTFVASGVCIAASGVLFAAAPNAGWVIVAAFVTGVGSAIANTTGMTVFSTRASAGRRGRALAGYSAALLGGQAIGPTLAGGIAVIGGWRVALLVAVGFGAVVVVLSGVLRSGETAARRVRHAERSAGHDEALPDAAPALTAAQRLCLYGVSFTAMLVIAAMPQTLVPIIGGTTLGLGADAIGLALGLGGVLRIVGAFVGGPLSDRHGRKVVLVPGLVVQAVGVGLLMVTGSVLAWLGAIAVMSLASFGVGTGAAMLGDRTSVARAGRALGRYRFVGDVGVVVGPLVAATVFEVAGQAVAVGLVSLLLLATAVASAVLLPETDRGASARGRSR